MTDRISLRGIRARGFHGVLDFERELGQTFVVDVDMVVDVGPAAAADDLRHYLAVRADAPDAAELRDRLAALAAQLERHAGRGGLPRQ